MTSFHTQGSLPPTDPTTVPDADQAPSFHAKGGTTTLGASTVADGDKGDIIVSGTGAVWTIDPSVASAFARTVLDDPDASTARATLGLGTAATSATSDFAPVSHTHSDVVAGGADGFMSGTDKTKLDGIASGATANSSDATLLARANHTGTQVVSTLTAAATARIFGRITAGAGIGEELTGTQVTTLLDVASGSLKGLLSSSDFTKLSGIATGATANSSDATLLSRANHTGTQLSSTISDFNSSTRAQVEAELVAGANVTITPGSTGATRTLTIAAAGSGGVADGDKGDITVSSTGSVWTIDNSTITLAKMADVATGTVFYRKTAATGAPEVQTLATLKTDLGLTGTNSGDQTITLTGDVTGSGTGSFAGTIAAGAVTLAKMANVATGTVFYRKTAATGAPEVQTLATLKTDLGLTGTNSGDQTITLTGDVTGSGSGSFAATIAAGAVTYAKMQNVSATSRIMGRITAGAGSMEELTGTQATSLLDVATGSLKGLMSSSDFTKLSGVATGATANSADATLLARANHTGTQVISTIAAAATSRFFGRITAAAGPGEELTGTQATSLLDVATGSLKGLMSSADFTKLAGIATGANTGTVTSIAFATGSTGLTLTGGPITTSGTITLGGTLVVANGGTGAATLTGILVGNGTSAFTAVTAPSGTIVGTTDTQTLTNKRVNPRSSTVTSSATPTINTDTTDVFGITALAVNITSMTTNLSGTPVDGQKLWIYIVGTAARTIAWGTSFEASTVALPTTTVTTNRLDVGFVWNAATSKWRCVGTA